MKDWVMYSLGYSLSNKCAWPAKNPLAKIYYQNKYILKRSNTIKPAVWIQTTLKYSSSPCIMYGLSITLKLLHTFQSGRNFLNKWNWKVWSKWNRMVWFSNYKKKFITWNYLTTFKTYIKRKKYLYYQGKRYK